MDGRYQVRITRHAYKQLEELKRYIAEELLAPDTAKSLLNLLRDEISCLTEFPARHPLVEEEPWHTEGVHRMPVRNFLVYYWIDDTAEAVQIIAVIYGRRDQLRELRRTEIK